MSKTGILTFHRTSNFGSCLQAYALYKKAVDLGFDCELIDYRCPAIEKREAIGKQYPFTPKGILLSLLYQPVIDRKAVRLTNFLKDHAKLGQAYTPESIHEANDAYDKFMVGSDIVWGLDITEDDYTYFLDFVRDPGKRYAFSSSVGHHETSGDTQRVGDALSRFDRIAVREEAAVTWVNALCGKEASWVCDPTMLLSADEWDQLVHPKTIKEKYVLVYFQDDKGKCLADAKRYAKAHGLKVYFINYALVPQKGTHSCKPTSLDQFLGLIKNAQMVFTASYHGMLYSLYYHKEFVFYTRAHSDRVLSLANRLGVEDRCADQKDINTYESINYGPVEEKLQQFRQESVAVLTEMLK